MWDPIEQAHSYIIYVQNRNQPTDRRTTAVNVAHNEHTLLNLIPGNSYDIGSKRWKKRIS